MIKVSQETNTPQQPKQGEKTVEQSGFKIEDNQADVAKSKAAEETQKSISNAIIEFTQQLEIYRSLEKSYDKYLNVLESAKAQLFALDISKNPTTACEIAGSIGMDQAVMSLEEFYQIYDMWRLTAYKLNQSGVNLGNSLSMIKSSLEKAKDSGYKQLKLNTSVLGPNSDPLSGVEEQDIINLINKYNAQYNEVIADINSKVFDFNIKERGYKMFNGLYPLKLEFVSHMNILCQVETDYEYSKNILHFGGLDLVEQLEAGFKHAADIVDRLSNVILRFNPTVFGKQQSLVYKSIAKKLRTRANAFIIEYNSGRK